MTDESAKRLPHDYTVEEFLSIAAAAKPVPGGGGISALAGALAVSMAEMALNFTIGKKKFKDVDERGRELVGKMSQRREALLGLVEADAKGYRLVSAALKMPRESEDDKRERREALNASMRKALEAPLETIRVIRSVATLLPEIVKIGNPNLIGDTGVAAALLPGAAKAGSAIPHVRPPQQVLHTQVTPYHARWAGVRSRPRDLSARPLVPQRSSRGR